MHPRRAHSAVLYFDHNATHPLSAAARAAWLDAVERYPANPSSPHRWGARAAVAMDEARARIAQRLGCSPHDIVWTSGATEADSTLIRHLGHTTGGIVLVSAIEHAAIRAAVQRWLPGRSESIPVSRAGVTDVEWIRDRVRRGGVAAVVMMAANNETGVLQPWGAVRDICTEVRVPFLCDAAQWIGKLPAAGLGECDYLTACAHKFGGPQGVGFMKCPANLAPLIVGGPQEDGRRAGTENVAGVLAMSAAFEEREEAFGQEAEIANRSRWREAFVAGLTRGVPGVESVGTGASTLWNTVAALMPAVADCRRRWVVKLDKLGFAVSTGSACASGKEQPSHVLEAMGYSGDESDRMLRFSAGWETPEADWDALLIAVRQAAAELKAV